MHTAALRQLHEGNIARYRLRRSEFTAWQQPQDQRRSAEDNQDSN